MIHRKTIEKEIIVFLIISLMVFSASFGTANNPLLSYSKNGNTQESLAHSDRMEQQGTQNRNVLFSQGFEWEFPPNGWTRIVTNTGFCDDYPQYSAHWDQFVDSPHNGSKAAYVWWDYQHQDEWLITPEISLIGIPNGELSFWSYGYEGSTYNDHYYVKISIDNGTTWTALFDLSSFPPNQGWNTYTHPYIINLADYHDQTIRLAWHAVSSGTDGIWYQWCIDDIEVTGGDDTPPVTTCTITGDYQATITMSATDDMSGVASTKYKLDYGAWTNYTTSIVYSTVGNHSVYFYSIDNAGNVEAVKNQNFTILSPIAISVQGGFGVSIVIKNVGTYDLTNVNWSILLDKGLIFVGKTKSGSIPTLKAGEEITERNKVFGFGKTNIFVSVETEYISASARIFLFFALGVK